MSPDRAELEALWDDQVQRRVANFDWDPDRIEYGPAYDFDPIGDADLEDER